MIWQEILKMRKRPLGSTGEYLTVVGLGTWSIAGGGWAYGWGETDERVAVATIHRALDAGINWIDTAPVYGLGRAEVLVGKVLKERRGETVFIATKCGLTWNRKRKVRPNLSRESIRKECHASLKRLGVEVIDLYQIHWPIPEERIEEAWETLLDLQVEGKVRYVGVCNFSVAQLKRIQGKGRVASLQAEYSLIARQPEVGVFESCRRSKMGFLAYSPLGSGLLTGRMTVERIRQLPPDDWRRRHPRFRPAFLEQFQAFMEDFTGIARKADLTPAQLAIAWVLRCEAVTSAIVGARRPEQVEESRRAGEVPWTDELEAAVEAILKKHALILRAVPAFG